MSLKSLISEAIVVDSMFDIENELLTIKETILEQMILEGVDDPGILKCVFMAGGPGSGKSFTAMEIFGIDKKLKSSFSSLGLKSVNSDSAFEAGLKKNGIDPKDLARIEKEDAELWNKITGGPSVSSDSRFDLRKGTRGGTIKGKSIRAKAKELTAKQKQFYEAGRLGMIIDGTGHVYSKIAKNKKYAESLGYDTYMVFVNTSLERAQERNQLRDRILPPKLLEKSWKDVQQNIGAFQNLFKNNFVIVDNSKTLSGEEAEAKFVPLVTKVVRKFVQKPIKNKLGKKWVEKQKLLKRRK